MSIISDQSFISTIFISSGLVICMSCCRMTGMLRSGMRDVIVS
eukprot:09227.XXX_536643_536771_1 [CDS] Oithona nana genome sequencing.